ncbi:MAG: hypothetical protein KDD73_17220, partial [Anaerolineales bacterium]|nr:hypothetical protein [Anaerolineales bacterium]
SGGAECRLQEAIRTMAATSGLIEREREQAARQIALLLGAFDELATVEYLTLPHDEALRSCGRWWRCGVAMPCVQMQCGIA